MSPTGLLQHQLVWQGLWMEPSTDTCQNITLPAKLRKRQVTMPRTWRWKCLQLSSGCQTTQALHGMKKRSSGGCQTRSTEHRTLPSQQRATKMAYGLQSQWSHTYSVISKLTCAETL